MMAEPGMHAWRNPWVRWSVVSLVAVGVLSLVVGFIWLPSLQSDFAAQGIWASICRAAGLPNRWGDRWGDKQAASRPEQHSTYVVLDPAMARPGSGEAVGRGATLALNCTMCHGARGLSLANAPNLAGQYAETIVKQLNDYQRGDRNSAIMQALSKNLSERDIRDLAAYYSYLPGLKSVPAGYGAEAPALISVGDPMRNIAPCASCHGGVDHKLGAPWLEGMPKEYLALQLNNFASGQRRNDSHSQMRNMARLMSAKDVEDVALFYARREDVSNAR